MVVNTLLHRTISEAEISDIGSQKSLSIFVVYCTKSVFINSNNYIFGRTSEYEEELIEKTCLKEKAHILESATLIESA